MYRRIRHLSRSAVSLIYIQLTPHSIGINYRIQFTANKVRDLVSHHLWRVHYGPIPLNMDRQQRSTTDAARYCNCGRVHRNQRRRNSRNLAPWISISTSPLHECNYYPFSFFDLDGYCRRHQPVLSLVTKQEEGRDSSDDI